MLKNQELPPLSDRLHKGMGQKLLLWWINHCKSLLPKDRRIGLAITELRSQKQVFIENARSKYSNKTATLVKHLLKTRCTSAKCTAVYLRPKQQLIVVYQVQCTAYYVPQLLTNCSAIIELLAYNHLNHNFKLSIYSWHSPP